MLIELNFSPETQLLMFLAGCSFVLAAVLSITDDGKENGYEIVSTRRSETARPLQPPRSPLQARTNYALTQVSQANETLDFLLIV